MNIKTYWAQPWAIMCLIDGLRCCKIDVFYKNTLSWVYASCLSSLHFHSLCMHTLPASSLSYTTTATLSTPPRYRSPQSQFCGSLSPPPTCDIKIMTAVCVYLTFPSCHAGKQPSSHQTGSVTEGIDSHGLAFTDNNYGNCTLRSIVTLTWLAPTSLSGYMA